jgi:hypothetical protein
MQDIKSTSDTKPEYAHAFHTAYDATAKDRAAIEASEVLIVNLDIQQAITTVLGALPRIKVLRPEIVALPQFEVGPFDAIEAYARALAYAQTVYLAASTTQEALPALVERAVGIRDLLVSDATALARRGLLDSKRLADLKGGAGYLNVASDLGVLVRMLRERWSEVATKSAIQVAELDEAEQIFEHITLAVAERTQQSTRAVAASDDRQRAFTLLIKAYDQARRAVTYLRWDHHDIDKIAPSLWAGRGGRSASNGGKNDRNEPPVDNAAPAPGAPEAPNGVSPAPYTPGLPGGSPFANG